MKRTRLSWLSLCVLPAAALSAETGSSGESEPVELAPITVTEDAAAAQGYRRESGSGGTKTDTSLMETPQAVSVISEALMRDQGVLTVQDALRYSAGVRSDAYGVDSRSDDAFVRGTAFTQYLDGLRQYVGYFSVTRTDPHTLDRVEVVRGPASVLYGQGTTGGLISLVSKLPLAEARHEIELQLGSDARRQIATDLTGPIAGSPQWSYRLIAVARDADAQLDYAQDNRLLLQPAISWRPDAETRWTLLGNLQNDDSNATLNFLPHSGTILPNPNGDIATSRFTSEPDFDRYDTRQRAITSLFDHRFDETWSITQNTRYSAGKIDYRTLYPDVYGSDGSNPNYPFLDDAHRTVARYSYVEYADRQLLVSDSQLHSRFSLAGMQHQLLLGVDYLHSDNQSRQGNGYDARPFDLYDPVYLGYQGPEVSKVPTTRTTQTGVYLQDQVRVGQRLTGTFGVRHDSASTDVAGSDSLADSETTMRAGLMFEAIEGVSPYVAYTESFQPIDYLDFYGQPYDSLRGHQTEVGLKIQPPGSQTLVTLTAFDLREKNRLSPDPDQPLNQVQLGKAKTRGFEAEANSQITRQLDLIGTYTYTDVETSAGRAAGVPKHQASVWSAYRFSIAQISGFSVGGGLRYIGETQAETLPLTTPDQLLIDAMLGYQLREWRFTLNAANLGDQRYVATCLDRGDCFYGPRRSVVGSLSYRF